MATTDQASFTLVQFEWTAPDRVDLVGFWAGVNKRDVSQATLILYSRHNEHRLEAVQGVFDDLRNWSAVFNWKGDPAAVERAELVLGGTLVVQLPTSSSNPRRRRFARTPLTVRGLEQEGAVTTESAPDADVLALHAAVVAAQQEAAEVRDELARLRAEAEAAGEQSRRERARRVSDTARLHEAMATLRRLAEDSLNREREATRLLSVKLDETEALMSGLEAESAKQREHANAAAAARDEAVQLVREQQEEIQQLQSTLDESAREARERSERSRIELAELRADCVRARQEAKRAGAQLASAETELAAARAAQEEADGLRSALAAAREQLERASGEEERLRGKLNALREVFDSG